MKPFLALLRIFLLFLIFPLVAQSQATTPANITIDRNGVLLSGKFFVSEGTGLFPTVIILHGFPGNDTDVLGIGDKISRSGINVLTFNYSGTFQSQGRHSWDNTQLDIGAALDFLHKPENITRFNIDTAQICLGGWCYGGGMALAYAASHPEIIAVFSIAGSNPGEFMKQYTSNPELKKKIDEGFAGVSAPGGLVRFEAGALPSEIAETGIDKINPGYDLKKCSPLLAPKDILLIGAWNDDVTSPELFLLPLYRALQMEKAQNLRIIAFQDNHSFRNSRVVVAQTVAEWVKTAPERRKSE
jgi:pimeloyl-ACP methyl ester carboxylesterase